MKYSKELIIGVFALIACFLLYFGFNFLKGSDLFSNDNIYYVTYDNVGGLTESNPVMLNGLNIGRVKAIDILKEDNEPIPKMRVTIEIRNDLVLGDSSRAILADNGFLGGKMIDLYIGTVEKPLESRSEIPGVIDKGLLGALESQALPTVSKVDSVLSNVNLLLGELSGAGLKINSLLGNLDAMSSTLQGSLRGNQGNIDATMQNLRVFSADLIELERGLRPIVGKMDNFTDKMNQLELEESLKKTNTALSELSTVLEKVNNGEGTLGALANDEELYQNLSNTAESLDKLLVDFRENPKRYVQFSVFGGKDKDEKNKKNP